MGNQPLPRVSERAGIVKVKPGSDHRESMERDGGEKKPNEVYGTAIEHIPHMGGIS